MKVLLVDDHRMVRDGLRAILSTRPGIEIVGDADNGRAAVIAVQKLEPDIVVMDVGMADLNGIEATRRIKDAAPRVQIVALSTHSDKRYVLGMIDAGASGYVLKEAASDDLVLALKSVSAGKKYLSPEITGVVLEHYKDRGQLPGSAYDVLGDREREVLQLLAEGKTSKAIAKELHLSAKTVETHRRNIMRKLDLHSVAELTKYAVREGLTSLEG